MALTFVIEKGILSGTKKRSENPKVEFFSLFFFVIFVTCKVNITLNKIHLKCFQSGCFDSDIPHVHCNCCRRCWRRVGDRIGMTLNCSSRPRAIAQHVNPNTEEQKR